MRCLEGLSKTPKTKAPSGKKKTTPPSRTSEVWRAPDGARFKRENVYKVEQDVGRVEKKKRIHELHPPFFFLAEPRRSSFPFLLPKKKKNRISFNPQKGLARLLQSCVSGCFRVSGLSSCAPGGPGPRRGLPPRWGSRDRRCCCGGGCAPGGCQRGGGRRGGRLRRVASSRPRGHTG